MRTVKEEVRQILQRGCPQTLHEEFFFLSCICKRKKKAVTVAAKSRQFTADKTGKGQFLLGNRRNLAGEGVVRKSSSPQRVSSAFNLCNSRSQGSGTWVLHQRHAASTWWCGPRPSIRKVGRNGETTIPERPDRPVAPYSCGITMRLGG